MKPCLRVAVIMTLISTGWPAHAQQNEAANAKTAPLVADAAAEDDAERAMELRKLEISAADFATKLATFPDGKLSSAAKRDAVLFGALAEAKFTSLGFSGLADPIAFRETDRLLARPLQRLVAAGPAAQDQAERAERVLLALRLAHFLPVKRHDQEIAHLLGLVSAPSKDQAAKSPDPTADLKAMGARFQDILAMYWEGLGAAPAAPASAKANRTAPIYSAPLAKLHLYPGDANTAARKSLQDRMKSEYAIEHQGDYLFEPEGAPPGNQVLVHYQKPRIGPAEETTVAPEEKAQGIDWKGKITVLPTSARIYDARRPVGKRWQAAAKPESLTFHLSRERGCYYVDSIDKVGDYQPAGLTTIHTKAIKALSDR